MSTFRLLRLLPVALLSLLPSTIYAAPQWSEDLANTFVYYAAAAICPSGIQDWTCLECKFVPGFKVTHYINNEVSGVLAYVGHSDVNKTIVFSYRGSQNAQNFVEDFFYTPTNNHLIPYTFDPSGKSQVEDGFWVSYLSIQQDILTAIDYYNNAEQFADYKVWVTGHSLGAAISLHGAMQAYISSKQATQNGLTVYNYGQPRVGDTNFANFYDARVPDTWVQINNSDPVPRVPPRALYQQGGYGVFTYTRQLHEVWYQLIGTEWIVHSNCVPDAGGEAPDCSDSDPASLGLGLPDVASVNDHLVYQYHSMLCGQGSPLLDYVERLPSFPNSFASTPKPTTKHP